MHKYLIALLIRKPFFKSIHKSNPYTNKTYTHKYQNTSFQRVNPFNITPVKTACKAGIFAHFTDTKLKKNIKNGTDRNKNKS